MKMTKLSLVAALAVSATFAGGDIAPVEPVVVAAVVDCNKDTTIAGKAQLYYYTNDALGQSDLFKAANSSAGTAVTFDVAHKLFDNVTANFSAVGYVNFGDDIGVNDFEGQPNGAFINVANLTATYADTTFIVGRQLIDTPLVGGFDWKLAPGAFEAAVVANKSIENLTLVAGYLTKWRPNNSGNTWVNLVDIDNGDNYTVGAVYGADALKVSAWYYNVDSGAVASTITGGVADKYTAIYADAGYNFGSFDVAAQIISTDYNTAKDALAYGLKVGTEFSGVNLTAAVSNTTDNKAGFVGRDSIYTSSWNYFTSNAAELNKDTLSWKVGASTELAGANLEASYAGYGDEGSELDVIVGYDVTDSVNLGLVYSLTDYDVNTNVQADAENALEVIATYKF
jgi:predicted porin